LDCVFMQQQNDTLLEQLIKNYYVMFFFSFLP